MRVLLLGGSGQVGAALAEPLAGAGELFAPDSGELDLTDAEGLRRAVRALQPALIVNAAAYTAVDRAEDEPDRAAAINAHAPAVLAQEARSAGAALIHYSTDYVFDGQKGSPYSEDDRVHPLNVYGRTKLEGDRGIMAVGGAYWIFRTSWIYGLTGHNFLRTMVRLLGERQEVGVVGDQHGAPSWAVAIARATLELVDRAGSDPVGFVGARSGLYHMSCGGETSWYGFARAIRDRLAQRGVLPLACLRELTTAEYPTRARRPAYTVLDNARLHRRLGVRLPSWEAALDEAFAQGVTGGLVAPASAADAAVGRDEGP